MPKINEGVERKRFEDIWAARTGSDGYGSAVDLFTLGSKYFKLYNIPDTHEINVAIPLSGKSRTQILVGHAFSSLPPVQCRWTYILSVYHPRNLSNVSAENTCVLFTLGTRYISTYFCSSRDRLSQLNRQMSKRSSSQYATLSLNLQSWGEDKNAQEI